MYPLSNSRETARAGPHGRVARVSNNGVQIRLTAASKWSRQSRYTAECNRGRWEEEEPARKSKSGTCEHGGVFEESSALTDDHHERCRQARAGVFQRHSVVAFDLPLHQSHVPEILSSLHAFCKFQFFLFRRAAAMHQGQKLGRKAATPAGVAIIFCGPLFSYPC